ncbi:MAG TPA: PilZ domain-containing protein [Candidatus Binatia bacterium]|nr:PilZ domain-containing protein [Candidatus Binatia bacterium]
MAQLKCPNCGREFVRRVSRSGFLEILLSYFYIYPFKCQLCGERFRHCQRGVRYVRIEKDRREYDRMEISFPVTFFGQDISGEGTVINVSMGGCTLRTHTKLETGAILNLSLQISKDVPAVVVEAGVVRGMRAEIAGIEFLLWQQSERERLQLFVRGLLIGRGIDLDPLVNRSEPVVPG